MRKLFIENHEVPERPHQIDVTSSEAKKVPAKNSREAVTIMDIRGVPHRVRRAQCNLEGCFCALEYDTPTLTAPVPKAQPSNPALGYRDCLTCDHQFTPHTAAEIFCSKECYRANADNVIFLGYMTCFDYDYHIVTRTREEGEKILLKEWKRQVRAAGTQDDFDVPFSKIDFAWLNEWNGSRVEAVLVGKIIRP